MQDTVRAKVTSKGQVTLPKAVRDALGLGETSIVEFRVNDGEATMRPVVGGFLARFASVEPRQRPEDWSEVRATVTASAARKRIRGG